MIPFPVISFASPLIKYAVAIAPCVLFTWWATDAYHDAKYNRYKNKVIEATLSAQREVLRVETELSRRGVQAVARHQTRSNIVNQSAKVALDALNTLPTDLPECRLTDGLRNAVNTARGSAASAIADSYGAQNGVRKTPADGRDAREPRAPRS
jgi:hypothetical protein